MVWGGTIELITHRLQLNHSSWTTFGLPKSVSAAETSKELCNGPCEEIMLSIISLPEDAADMCVLFKNWRPLITMLSTPLGLTRKGRKCTGGGMAESCL